MFASIHFNWIQNWAEAVQMPCTAFHRSKAIASIANVLLPKMWINFKETSSFGQSHLWQKDSRIQKWFLHFYYFHYLI
jgi:hypothetical protein